MKKVLLFGTGSTGRRIYDEIKENTEIVGFLDNDTSKWGSRIEDVPVIGNGENLDNISFDEIIVCSLPGMSAIKKQLIDMGIPGNMINIDYISTQVNARINFLHDFANLHKNLSSDICIAEGGVYQGDFAKEINTCFPHNRLFLFDTFEGFDERDIAKEQEESFSIFEK